MLRETILKQLILAARQLWGDQLAVDSIEVTFPDDPAFGDLATNAALVLSRQIKMAPRDAAGQLMGVVERWPEVKRCEVAGPGFINLWLQDERLTQEVSLGLRPVVMDESSVEPVLVEYSDPNPFKPLHAGHLYTTLVGDMISRLIERSGRRVIRLNYGGDVGLHVARAMWGIIADLGGEYPDRLDDAAGNDRAAWMGACYARGYASSEDDPKAQAEIVEYNRRVYELHANNDHESAFAQIYWTCRQWSYEYFPELYRQLDVKPFDRFIPESEVTPLGLATVRKQQERGVYVESQGAVVFEGDKYGLHTRVFINSAGLPTYEAKDVGLLLTKWHDYHFGRSIVITSSEQSQYMEVMLKSVEQFDPDPVKRSQHLTHGVVKLVGGMKMSSRKGNVLLALQILELARKAGAESAIKPSEASIVAAVKYSFAKVRVGGDIAYDPYESVALEGNSGPYLQYAHARARSIALKGEKMEHFPAGVQYEEGERLLLRKLAMYPDVIATATSELMPHGICTYLYELAQLFNRFYEHNRVIGSDREAVRLGLVTAYADVLKDGLELLGITAPDKI